MKMHPLFTLMVVLGIVTGLYSVYNILPVSMPVIFVCSLAGFSNGPAAAAAPGPCVSCKGAVAGTKTNSGLQSGTSYVQHEIATTYGGVCDGKYVYDYTNLTSNKTIGMEVRTSGGESWTFTLKPGQKTSIKSSTEFTGGNYQNIRLSEVMN